MSIIDIAELFHYGTPRHSGRYPWGSGKDPYQRTNTLSSRIKEMKKNGLTDKEIADNLGMTIEQMRAKYSIDINAQKAYDIARAKRLHEKGLSNVEIGKMMGKPESTIRNYLKSEETVTDKNTKIAEYLKQRIGDNNYIDIGAGSELDLNITETRLKTIAAMLEEEGYNIYTFKIPQVTNPGKFTKMKVIAPADATFNDVVSNKDRILTINEQELTDIDNLTDLAIKYPKSLDSKRLGIVYAEEGGKDKDGLIEIRPGVEDLDLGNCNYAQVRIAVDDKFYLKGMAIYNNDLPEGIDIRFNTNKHVGTPVMNDDPNGKSVLKMMKDDKDNPFGATIKAQSDSLIINKVNEEGDWGNWSKTLPSQFLSKQNLPLIKSQLNLAYREKADEFDTIMSIDNPTIRAHELAAFADDCDASAVHLKAAALPRQCSNVLIPLISLKDNECYAPNYKDGEEVVLVRFPHEGTFQIPRLIVNNKNKEGIDILTPNAKDAIGINSKTAEILSGADFDGDSVLVIPTKTCNISTRDPLPGLKDYDAKESYPGYPGMERMTSQQKGMQMGLISNLITDMTLKGASEEELTRAVKHANCVIDAEKHGLDWKRSMEENDITGLKKRYQDKGDGKYGGASTLISRSTSQAQVLERKDYHKINPETGGIEYRETGSTYLKTKTYKDGTTIDIPVKRTTKSSKMAEVDDAFKLSSGTEQERYYAEYANKLKAMANAARKALISTPTLKTNPEAKIKYKEEVASLANKLQIALRNAPRERQAQIYANSVVRAKRDENPDLSKKELGRIRSQAMESARIKYRSHKRDYRVLISDREWEAIQAGAITDTTLRKILNNTDTDSLRARAIPNYNSTLSVSKQYRIQAMASVGFTNQEIAETMGLSTTTVAKYL